MLKFSRPLLVLSIIFVSSMSHAQLRAPEVIVEERSDVLVESSIQVAGGLTVSGTTTTGSQAVNGTHAVSGNQTVGGTQTIGGGQSVTGDVKFRNSVHDYARYVAVPASSYYDFIFTTDFSAGFLIEVTTVGILGPSAATLNSEKHVFSFYMYSNNMLSYEYKKATLYQLGDETASIDVNIYAVGANNQFLVRVSNSSGSDYSTTVRMNVVTRGTPTLTAQF